MLPLDSSHLVLRRFADGDTQAFATYRNDPDVARYLDWSGCSPAAAVIFVREQQSQELVPGEWLQIDSASTLLEAEVVPVYERSRDDL